MYALRHKIQNEEQSFLVMISFWIFHLASWIALVVTMAVMMRVVWSMWVMVSAMTVVAVSIVVIIMSAMSIFGIFFLAELVGLIPRCFDEYLKCGIQMNDDDEEYETHYPEYRKEKEFYTHECKEGNNSGCNEWKNKEEDCDKNCPQIEENHGEVELHRDSYIPDRHSSWCRECCYCSFPLEDNEELRIGETHIQKKWEYEVHEHDIWYWCKIFLPKYAEKKYVERNDGKWTEYGDHIMCLE